MKRIIKIVLVIFVFFASFALFNINSKAYNDLDRIDDYVVTVDPDFNDGSLNINSRRGTEGPVPVSDRI